MKDFNKYLYNTLGVSVTHDIREKLEESIKKLPEDNRNAIELHFLENIPRKEVARRLNWSLTKVNNKIARGITLLKAELNPEHFSMMEKIIDETNQRLLR